MWFPAWWHCTEQTTTGVTSEMKKNKKAYLLSVWKQHSYDSDLRSFGGIPTQCQALCQIFSHPHTHTHPYINTTSLVASHHMLPFPISVGHNERKMKKSLGRPGTLLTRCKQQYSWIRCCVIAEKALEFPGPNRGSCDMRVKWSWAKYLITLFLSIVIANFR